MVVVVSSVVNAVGAVVQVRLKPISTHTYGPLRTSQPSSDKKGVQ